MSTLREASAASKLRGLFVDTETGGLDSPTCALTQIAVVAFEIDAAGVKIGDTLNLPIRYYRETGLILDPEALKVQGKTVEELSAGERLDEREALRRLQRFCAARVQGQVWAWNAAFDAGFLAAAIRRCGMGKEMDRRLSGRWMVCGQQLARSARAVGRLPANLNPACPLHEVGKLAGHPQAEPHDALSDAKTAVHTLHFVQGQLGIWASEGMAT